MHLRALLLSGMMAALAVVLQTAPIWLGQPAGFALAILACLPMAILAAAEPRAAALAVPAAALLCALFQPEEGWVFGLANGPFGVALGLAFRRGLAGWRAPCSPRSPCSAGWRCSPGAWASPPWDRTCAR